MSSCAISHIAVSHTWEEMDDGISELWRGAVAQLTERGGGSPIY